MDKVFLTMGEASRTFGIPMATLSKDRRKGRFSAERRPGGAYRIDRAELVRAYAHRIAPGNPVDPPVNPSGAAPEPPREGEGEGSSAGVLRVLEERLTEQRETIRDLRERLDAAERERRDRDRQLLALLDDRRSPDEPRRGFWRRLWAAVRG